MAKHSASTAEDEVVEHRDDSAINRRLRAQYAEIARLAGGLAHEIKNPLSTMSLNLDLLVEDFHGAETPRDKRVLQKLERVRKETERLNDIVEDFLRFAKVQDLKAEPSDLNAVVDDLRDFCEPQAMGQGIVIRTQYDPDLPLVPLDGAVASTQRPAAGRAVVDPAAMRGERAARVIRRSAVGDTPPGVGTGRVGAMRTGGGERSPGAWVAEGAGGCARPRPSAAGRVSPEAAVSAGLAC